MVDEEKLAKLREFERMLDLAKLRALSKASQERKLTDAEFREFRRLAKEFGAL